MELRAGGGGVLGQGGTPGLVENYDFYPWSETLYLMTSEVCVREKETQQCKFEGLKGSFTEHAAMYSQGCWQVWSRKKVFLVLSQCLKVNMKIGGL